MSTKAGVVLLAMVPALLAGGCGSGPAKVATRPGPTVASTTLESFPVTTPVPAGQPGKMVPDPSGTALWWWAVGDDRQARVYRFSTTDHRLASWRLGDSVATGLQTGIQYGIAVGPPGVVWVGANLKLVRLNTATRAVKIMDVPPMPPEQPPAPAGPAQIADLHPIAGVAASPSGQLALATAGSTAIPIYDSVTDSFRQLALPNGLSADDVAYLPDDTLAVGLEPTRGNQLNGAVLLVDASGRTKLVTGVQASFVMPSGTRFLSGQIQLYWIYPNGTVKPGPAGLPGQEWIAYPSTHPAWPLSDGHVAMLARGYDGLTDMAGGQPARSVTLAERPCPTGAGSGGSRLGPATTATSAPPTTTQTCHTHIGALAAVGDTVWFLEDGQSLIWRVAGL